MPVVAIGMPGAWELGVVLVIVLIVFGPGQLPKVFHALGQGIKSFRDGQKDAPEEEPRDVTRELPPAAEEAQEVKARELA